MSNKKIQVVTPHFGSAVEGMQCFRRPHVEGQLLRILNASNGVAMFGLRRTGKSTLTRLVQTAMRGDGYVAIEIDAQGFRALDHLLFEILRALPKGQGLVQRMVDWVSGGDAAPVALREALKQAAQGFGVHDASTTATVTAYWQAIADQIARALREDRPKLLLTIDEFPFMCRGILEYRGGDENRVIVNQLLAGLRLWRDAGLKMLLTGSIGMAALEREYRLDPVHLNDLSPFTVPPLGDEDPDEPRRFVDALVAGTPELEGWTRAHTDALLHESVAMYPSFLQFAFTTVRAVPLASPERFAEIFAATIRPRLDGPFLDQFDMRIKSYRALGDTVSVAFDLLGRIVRMHPTPCPRDALVAAAGDRVDGIALAEVLKILQEDGFLLERTSRDGTQDWRLSSDLVLTWWRQRGLAGGQ